MTYQEIKVTEAAIRIDLQIFKDLYTGKYLLEWRNGQICGRYQDIGDVESIVYGECEAREIEV